MPARSNRRKISTTVAPETHAFLRSLVRRGKAANIAEAVDRAVAFARRSESRKRLGTATAAYYESISRESLRAEQRLEKAVSKVSSKVDFDGE